jgi:hypothetical protein
MAKYDPLRRFLRRRREDVVRLTYADIERIIGAILPHAAANASWWSNEAGPGRGLVQSRAWLDAGFRVAQLEPGKAVAFERPRRDGSSPAQTDNGGPASARQDG